MPLCPAFRRLALVAAFLAATGQAATAVAHGEAHEHAAAHLAGAHAHGDAHSHDGGIAAGDAAALATSVAVGPTASAADPHAAHPHTDLAQALKSRADVVAAEPPAIAVLSAPLLTASTTIDAPQDDQAPPDASSRPNAQPRAPPRA